MSNTSPQLGVTCMKHHEFLAAVGKNCEILKTVHATSRFSCLQNMSKHVQHHREAMLTAWAFHCKSQAYTRCQGAAKSRRHFLDSCRDKQCESLFKSLQINKCWIIPSLSVIPLPVLNMCSPRTPVGWRSALPSCFLANSSTQIQDLPMFSVAPSVLDDEGEAPSAAAIALRIFRDNFLKLEPKQTKGHFQSQMSNRLLLKPKQINRSWFKQETLWQQHRSEE